MRFAWLTHEQAAAVRGTDTAPQPAALALVRPKDWSDGYLVMELDDRLQFIEPFDWYYDSVDEALRAFGDDIDWAQVS